MHLALYIRIGSHTIQTKNDGTISVSLLRQDGTWGLPNPHLPLAVTNCNLEPDTLVTEWIAANDTIIRDQAISGVKVQDVWRKFYILWNY
jgi:hypothetical protein